MANNTFFMSPRSDLTIRNLTAEQIEAISKAAVDIVGGIVSFSESAIYESEDTTRKKVIDIWLQCSYPSRHDPHLWKVNEWDTYSCPGRNEDASG